MDLGSQLHKDINVDFEVCPVGGHNMHGKVERKIREINSSIEKSILNERLHYSSGKQLQHQFQTPSTICQFVWGALLVI